MNANTDLFEGDGRTLNEIGKELGLNQIAIHQVQQDTDKPDKVVMNIWRKICPTRADRIYVKSITHVPLSTLQNIYGESISFINLTNKIAHNSWFPPI